MKTSFQRGQALTEYLVSLAALVIVAIGGVELVLHAVQAQWQTLTFWLILPSP